MEGESREAEGAGVEEVGSGERERGTANFQRWGLRELDAAIRQAFSIEFN